MGVRTVQLLNAHDRDKGRTGTGNRRPLLRLSRPRRVGAGVGRWGVDMGVGSWLAAWLRGVVSPGLARVSVGRIGCESRIPRSPIQHTHTVTGHTDEFLIGGPSNYSNGLAVHQTTCTHRLSSLMNRVLERVVCRVRFARVSCPWLRLELAKPTTKFTSTSKNGARLR